jgi:hypothetical protein
MKGGRGGRKMTTGEKGNKEEEGIKENRDASTEGDEGGQASECMTDSGIVLDGVREWRVV